MQKYDIQTSNGEKSKKIQNIENAFQIKQTTKKPQKFKTILFIYRYIQMPW